MTRGESSLESTPPIDSRTEPDIARRWQPPARTPGPIEVFARHIEGDSGHSFDDASQPPLSLSALRDMPF